MTIIQRVRAYAALVAACVFLFGGATSAREDYEIFRVFAREKHLFQNVLQVPMDVTEPETLYVYRGDNLLQSDEWVATGDECAVLTPNGRTVRSAVIAIMGDVKGTGTMNLPQVVEIARAISDPTLLDGPYLAAADFNNSGNVDLTDAVSAALLLKDNMKLSDAKSGM